MERLSTLLTLCGGNPLVTVDSPHKGPVMQNFGFCVVCLNKHLNKQSTCQWFRMPWCSCEITVMYSMWALPQRFSTLASVCLYKYFLLKLIQVFNPLHKHTRGLKFGIFLQNVPNFNFWGKFTSYRPFYTFGPQIQLTPNKQTHQSW